MHRKFKSMTKRRTHLIFNRAPANYPIEIVRSTLGQGRHEIHLHPSGSHYPRGDAVEGIEHLEKSQNGENRCHQPDDA
jgi:hypothetical protein